MRKGTLLVSFVVIMLMSAIGYGQADWSTDYNEINAYNEVARYTDPLGTDAYWWVVGPFDVDGDSYQEFMTAADLNYDSEGGIALYLYEHTGVDNEMAIVWDYFIEDAAWSYDAMNGLVDLDSNDVMEFIVGGRSTDDGAGGYTDAMFIFEVDTTGAATGEQEAGFVMVTSVNPAEEAGLENLDCRVHGISAADLDGDNVMELVINEGQNDGVIVMSFDPLASFEFPNWIVEFVDTESFSSVPYGNVIADFNADGYMDFAIPHWGATGHELGVYTSLDVDDYELVNFIEGTSELSGSGSMRAVDAYDFDGDGYKEIVQGGDEGGVAVYTNSGDLEAMTSAVIWYGDTTAFSGLQICNPDVWRSPWGKRDIVAALNNGTLIDIEYNGGADVLDPMSWDAYEVNYPDTLDYQDVIVADLDSDGADDMIVVTVDENGYVMHEYDPYQRYDIQRTGIPADSSTGHWRGFQTRHAYSGCDLDQDGKQEVLLTDYLIKGVHIYEVVGDNELEWVFHTIPDDSASEWATPRYVMVADMDGNGRDELIFVQQSSNSDKGIHVYEWDGVNDNTYEFYHMAITIDGTAPDRVWSESFTIGDPDQDGYDEVIWANNGIDQIYDGFIIVGIDGSFESGVYAAITEFYINRLDISDLGGTPWNATVGDLDGDEDLEVIFGAWDHGYYYIVESTGANEYEYQVSFNADTSWTDACPYGAGATADMNNDGKDEYYTRFYGGTMDGNLIVIDSPDDVADLTMPDNIGVLWDATSGLGPTVAIDNKIVTFDYSHARALMFEYVGGDDGDVKDPNNWDFSVVVSWPFTMGGFGGSVANDMDGDGRWEVVQGFLEYGGGNPLGYAAGVVDVGDVLEPVSTQPWNMITPDDYVLRQNYPNPFNPTTTIEFSLPLAKDVTLTVYDLLGREVVRLVDNQYRDKGTHSVTWNSTYADGRPAPAGLYLYTLRAGNVVKTAKMTLVK